MPDLKAAFETYLPQIEHEMRATVNLGCRHGRAQPTRFNAQLRYHLGFANADGSPTRVPSGKRIRPMLVLFAAQACGATAAQALPAAVAVELLHNFSLIHDDIEDHDELRRGRPTLWKLDGIEQAINAGDAMFAQAHLALLGLAERGVPADRVVRAMRCFDEMCVHLTIGQHLDLAFESRDNVTEEDYLEMISGKTGALVIACCELGAIVAGATPQQQAALRAYGHGVGRAFQIQDDVLGIWGDTARTGKAQGDLARRKKSLPVLHACDRDPALRAAYFGSGPLDLQETRQKIEEFGGREHAEAIVKTESAQALEALTRAPLADSGRELLVALAGSLIGRVA